jgi:hypothetical protein
MTSIFFKTNWFWISLALLIAAAFVQKKMLFRGPSPLPQKREQSAAPPAEKYTAAAAEPSTAQLAMVPVSSRSLRPLPALDDATAMAFLRRFSNVAVGEHKKYGVPASALLACAYVSSFAGQRPTAQQANNYFALPCSPDWQGRTASLDGHCYRRYERAWDSFRDFSLHLQSQGWMAEARSRCGTDWRKWAAELAAHDLSDVANFDTELRKAVEAYRLFELDGKR